MEDLTEAILAFKRTGTGLDSIVRRIAVGIYSLPRRKLGWSEDDCSEFFCRFYPRLPSLIDRFRYTGKPFEAFLAVTLKWQWRTFAARRSQELVRERVLSREELFWGEGSCEAEEAEEAFWSPSPRFLTLTDAARKVLKVDSEGRIRDGSIRRRLLFLLLQSCTDLPTIFIDEAARLLRCDCDWLHGLVREIRDKTEARRERATYLRDKRNRHFFRICCCHEQLAIEPRGEVKEELFRRLLLEKRRLGETIKELSKVPLSPTHCDIAELLHVPKGSVDSGIFYLKIALKNLSPIGQIGYA